MEKGLSRELKRFLSSVKWSYGVDFYNEGTKVNNFELDIKRNLVDEFLEKFSHRIGNGTTVRVFTESSMDYRYKEEDMPFLREHKDVINWECAYFADGVSEALLVEMKDRISLDSFSLGGLSEETLELLADKIDWDKLTTHRELSEDFIRRNYSRFDKQLLSRLQKLSLEFIDENSRTLSHRSLLLNKHIVVDGAFLERYKDHLDITNILIGQRRLHERLFVGLVDEICWDSALCYRFFSEGFLEDNFDKLDKDSMARHQKMSKGFIERHLDELELVFLLENQQLKGDAFGFILELAKMKRKFG